MDDLEFANKANIEAARKFKAQRDALKTALQDIVQRTTDAEAVKIAFAALRALRASVGREQGPA